MPSVDELRERIDDRLAELLPMPADDTDLVAAAMRDGVLAPGKRVRPLLMLLVGNGLEKTSSPALLDLACAVEMVHAASLFLDDMPCMDNARLRRGRLAVHARYGEDVAMLGAVALLSHACGIVAGADGLTASQRAQLVLVLCEAVGVKGLVRGQYRDLREGAGSRAAGDIASANEQKTASLFAAALDMVAIACSAEDSIRSALRAAATELGQAFQLKDYLEDLTQGADGNTAPLGKDRNKDAGKSTMVALLGREAVQDLLDEHLVLAETQLRCALPEHDGAVMLVRMAFPPSPRPQPQPQPQPQPLRSLKLQVF